MNLNLNYGGYTMKIENGQHLVSKDGINFVDLSEIESLNSVDMEVIELPQQGPMGQETVLDEEGNPIHRLTMDRTCIEHAYPDVMTCEFSDADVEDSLDIDDLMNSVDFPKA